MSSITFIKLKNQCISNRIIHKYLQDSKIYLKQYYLYRKKSFEKQSKLTWNVNKYHASKIYVMFKQAAYTTLLLTPVSSPE